MMDFSNISKIVIVTGATDLRKGIDGYVSIIQDHYCLNPFDETVFIFCNRQHNKIKCLYWDKTGALTITHQQLKWLLEGLKTLQKVLLKN